MASFNRFGAVYTEVVELYTGSAAADFGGQAVIENAMDRATREVVSALPASVFEALTYANKELLENYTDGSTNAFTLGITPVVTGSVHVWTSGQDADCGILREGESEEDLASVNVSTGAVVLVNTPGEGLRVFASYDVDNTNANFSQPGLADMVVLGAAAEIGGKVYAQATNEWELVTQYRERYQSMLSGLRDGSYVPELVRTLRWCKDIERAGGGRALGTVIKWRG